MSSEREFREKARRALADIRAANAGEYHDPVQREEAVDAALERAAALLGADLGQELADKLGVRDAT